MIKESCFLILLLSISMIGCKKNVTGPDTTTPPSNNGWKLVWADEFNYTGLPDSTKWTYDVGGSGWGNNELEYYTDHRSSNARVENGNLVIVAINEPFGGKQYTSARLVSTGTASWTYGRMEIRAVLPKGRGTWPAIWMLPTDWTYGDGGWPDNGELDIMEHVGFDQGVIHGSIHCHNYNGKINTQKTATIRIPDCSSAYHVYAMEWTPEKIDYFVDSVKYFTFANEHTGYQTWPFDKAFHFIFNIAVGGDWGGAQGVDNSIFPQPMFIDYVRVYKSTQ
jgi:beta-glucanase (GH16 family)